MKRLFIILATTLVALTAVGATAVYAITEGRIRRTYDNDFPVPPIPTDAVAIARGEYLARVVANCAFCHGEYLEGRDYIDGGPLGHLYTPNLTRGRGGVGGSMTDADWVAAIRYGIGRDQRSLWFMPSETYQVMTDEDLGALIAYLRNLPPVDHELPTSRIGPLGRVLNVAGRFPFLTAEIVRRDIPPAARIEREPTPEYGYYVARLGACIGCHGSDLRGGPVPAAPPGTPPAADLTSTLDHYSEDDFFRALRSGVRPDGSTIDSFMPLPAGMGDGELRALWVFLKGR